MGKFKLWSLSAAGLVLAGVLGFLAFRGLQPMLGAPACAHSQAANLALNLATDAATQQRIQALDAAYGAEYAQACDRLCADRGKLSERLITARADDPEVAAALARIHAQQARMEQMTWNHIISVRDLLPAAERAVYIRRVQEDWARGQARLRTVANAGACRMPEHGGK
jgi:hypothetical protein